MGDGAPGMSDSEMDSYQRNPELTPYVSRQRYGKPKEDFKTVARALERLLDTRQRLKVADIGCGNGELLYHLSRLHPHWELHGFDHTKEFIETARSYPGLAGVHFEQRGLMEIQGSYDVVIATCFLSLFRDIARPIRKMLELCREGGFVLGTGLFNPYDIEVRVEFCDNTHEQSRGRWRTDFNRHSQQSIRRMLEGRVRSVTFEECVYDVHLEPDPERPIRVWTIRDESGKTLLVNGACQIVNQTLLTIHK